MKIWKKICTKAKKIFQISKKRYRKGSFLEKNDGFITEYYLATVNCIQDIKLKLSRLHFEIKVKSVFNWRRNVSLKNNCLHFKSLFVLAQTRLAIWLKKFGHKNALLGVLKMHNILIAIYEMNTKIVKILNSKYASKRQNF